MHDAEWAYALRLRRAVLAPLLAAEVSLTSYIILRVHDYLVAMLLTRRAERVLVEAPAENGEPLPAPPAAQLEALAKQRERARKLLAEVEAFLPKPAADSGKPMGLADYMKPIMKKFKHLENVYFPEDLAFRLAKPDSPGAPFRYPRETPPAPYPAEDADYVVEESPAEGGGDEAGELADAPRPQRNTVPPPTFKHYIPSYLRDKPQEESASAPGDTVESPDAPAPPAPSATDPSSAPPQRPRTPPYYGRETPPRYVAIVT